MSALNLKSLDPANIMRLPEVPESYGPRNEEEQRVYEPVKAGLDSGQLTPVDAAFFSRLRAHCQPQARVNVWQVFIQLEAAARVEAVADCYAQVVTPALIERFVTEFETVCRNLTEFPGIGSLRFAHLLEDAVGMGANSSYFLDYFT